MSRLMQRFGLIHACGAVALLSLGAAAGCAENQPSLIVEYAVSFNEDCEAAPDENSRITQLTVDTNLQGDVYAAFVVTNNQLAVDAENSNSGTNDSEITMRDVDVTISLPQVDGFEPITYNQKLSSDSLTGAGTAVYAVQVPRQYIEELAGVVPADGTLLANMKVEFYAKRASNSGINDSGIIDSRPFVLPMTLCDGCALNCQETFAVDTNEEVCFANNRCNFGSGMITSACGIQNVLVTPRCCGGEDETIDVASTCQ